MTKLGVVQWTYSQLLGQERVWQKGRVEQVDDIPNWLVVITLVLSRLLIDIYLSINSPLKRKKERKRVCVIWNIHSTYRKRRKRFFVESGYFDHGSLNFPLWMGSGYSSGKRLLFSAFCCCFCCWGLLCASDFVEYFRRANPSLHFKMKGFFWNMWCIKRKKNQKGCCSDSPKFSFLLLTLHNAFSLHHLLKLKFCFFLLFSMSFILEKKKQRFWFSTISILPTKLLPSILCFFRDASSSNSTTHCKRSLQFFLFVRVIFFCLF